MKEGDKVRPTEGHLIHCSHYVYDHAYVISLDPFMLVSEEGDMTWRHEDPADFEVVT